MKSFSSIIGACVIIGILATDFSNDGAEIRGSIERLLDFLCDKPDHSPGHPGHLESHFADDFYNKLFDAYNSESMAMRNKNEMSFQERLVFIYNAMHIENELGLHCLHPCTGNETNTDCLKVNIMITILSHSLHSINVSDDGTHAIESAEKDSEQISPVKSDTAVGKTYISNDSIGDVKRFLQTKYVFNQMINQGEDVASIDNSNIMLPDMSFEGDIHSHNSNGTNKCCSPVNDGTVAQFISQDESSQVDILKNDRGMRVERGTNDNSSQPIHSQIHGSSNVTFNGITQEYAERTIPDYLNTDAVLSKELSSVKTMDFQEHEGPTTILINSQQSSNVYPSLNILMEENSTEIEKIGATNSKPSNMTSSHTLVSRESSIIEKEGMDVSSIRNELMNVSDVPVHSNNPNSIVMSNGLKNETTSSDTENKKVEPMNFQTSGGNVTVKLSSEVGSEKNIVEKKESNLTELFFVNVTIPSRETKKLQAHYNYIEESSTVKTNTSFVNLKSSLKDVKDQDVPYNPRRLVFGITACLIVLGLAAGAVAISYFVLQKESPCPRRQRSSINIDQSSQSRG